jgi:hypothetical protein
MKWLMLLQLVALGAGRVDTAAGVQWTTPEGWTVEPKRPMRVATYKVPPSKGDAEGGELGVFHFGQGQGGDVDANVSRWVSQFEQPDGSPSSQRVKTTKKTVAGFQVTTVDLSGTYTASMGPMAPKTPKPGYRLLGAIVEGPQGAVFFKLTAPAKTAASSQAAFDALIASLQKS